MNEFPVNRHSPPHDPYVRRLSAASGWSLQSGPADSTLELTPDGLLRIARATAVSSLLFDSDWPFGALMLPPTVVYEANYGIILIDKQGRLRVLDRCLCAFRSVPCGTDRQDRRHLHNPVAMTIGNGRLYICDPGHPDRAHFSPRVLMLALPSLAYAGEMRPAAHAALPQAWQPVACALSPSGGLLVADAANGMVHFFNRQDRWVQAHAGFGALASLAVDIHGRLLTQVAGVAEVRVSNRQGVETGVIRRRSELEGLLPPLPFQRDSAGNLHLLPLCTPTGKGTGKDLTGWFDRYGQVQTPIIETDEAFAASTTLTTTAIDSRIADCQWDAIELKVSIPQGCRIQLSCLTLDDAISDPAINELPQERWQSAPDLRASEQTRITTLITASAGRYLWLRLRLLSDGRHSPEISAIDLHYPRLSLRRYLPAIFGAEPRSADFTDRLLGVFDAGFRSVEQQIDEQARLYDPASTPADTVAGHRPDFLSWLAAWMGIKFHAVLSVPERRRLLSVAGRVQRCTGTLTGLRQKLLVVLGMQATSCVAHIPVCGPLCQPLPDTAPQPPMILEHFRLRRWLSLGAATLGDRAVLWGEKLAQRTRLGSDAPLGNTRLNACTDPALDPWNLYAHRLSIFLPAARLRNPARQRMIEQLVADDLPAHVQAAVEYVEPRMRIGIQSSIGFDTAIARLPAEITLGEVELGRASVLGPATLQDPDLAPSSRVGRDSRLR